MILSVKKLCQDAVLPKKQSEGASGFDFHSIADYSLKAGQRVLVQTGISMAIPKGYELEIRPRSGLAYKSGISVLNSPGTIDSDYRGEIKILLINHSKEDFYIKKNDRIAQGVINKVFEFEFEEVQSLSDSKRGEKGFGSTGL